MLFFCIEVNFWLHTIMFKAWISSESCFLDPQVMRAEKFLEVIQQNPNMDTETKTQKGN